MAKKRNRITAAMSKTIAETSPLIKKATIISTEKQDKKNIIEIELSKLQTNPYQPRIDINLHSLNELISSIEQNGLLQPIIVTEKQTNGLYTIIAGHRRYEAHKIMGKNTIPSILIKNIENKDLAVLSLTENLMRENLHPIENAIAMKNILDNEIVESQNKLAEYVGLSRGYVSKLMNILKLPTNIIKIIKDDNYTDINVLVLLNKIKSEEDMLIAYNVIKSMLRTEAEQYIKNNYLFKTKEKISVIDVKNSKSKISININIKQLSDEQKNAITNKINTLNNEILSLVSTWTN